MKYLKKQCIKVFVLALGFAVAFSVRAETSEATRLLQARSAEFKQEVLTVTDGVYTAVGFSVQPVTMIEGDNGLIIVDAGMDTASATQVLAAFRKISAKPIKALIFTHGHGDHTGGGRVFLENDGVQVWARQGFGEESHKLSSSGLTINNKRGARQAGFLLPPEQRINNGIAQAYWPKRGGAAFHTAKIKPTHWVTEPRQRVTIEGVDVDLVAATGETYDQLYIWLPRQKVLFSGDNFYKSWPNLYPVRGAPYRDVDAWARSIDVMLGEGAHHLVPGHTRPISGKARVAEVLTNYRDAIRFVFDKTIDGMNKGLGPDELVGYVQLPEKYRNKDYLRPYYGNPEWAVRAIFTAYLGWFDGNPTNLFPLAPVEEAKRVAALAGGEEALLTQLKQALKAADYQWAAQLSDHLMVLRPEDPEPKRLKADALSALAENLLTATGRNYYLTVAQELRQTAETLAQSPSH